jgi:hypothetical protein
MEAMLTMVHMNSCQAYVILITAGLMMFFARKIKLAHDGVGGIIVEGQERVFYTW